MVVFASKRRFEPKKRNSSVKSSMLACGIKENLNWGCIQFRYNLCVYAKEYLKQSKAVRFIGELPLSKGPRS